MDGPLSKFKKRDLAVEGGEDVEDEDVEDVEDSSPQPTSEVVIEVAEEMPQDGEEEGLEVEVEVVTTGASVPAGGCPDGAIYISWVS